MNVGKFDRLSDYTELVIFILFKVLFIFTHTVNFRPLVLLLLPAFFPFWKSAIILLITILLIIMLLIIILLIIILPIIVLLIIILILLVSLFFAMCHIHYLKRKLSNKDALSSKLEWKQSLWHILTDSSYSVYQYKLLNIWEYMEEKSINLLFYLITPYLSCLIQMGELYASIKLYQFTY